MAGELLLTTCLLNCGPRGKALPCGDRGACAYMRVAAQPHCFAAHARPAPAMSAALTKAANAGMEMATRRVLRLLSNTLLEAVSATVSRL